MHCSIDACHCYVVSKCYHAEVCVVLKYSITVSARYYFHDQDNPEESEEDVSNDLVSHANAASALELALRQVEHNAAATTTDLMFMLP
ncbi:hypothetical protein AVEN_215247-1 [Araneus ventricosus]|uniref:Uncharacterized protein n=1 Tax=Araneus ventricosus TaxID=182803 RepID=A0A4Y2M581_ARAVE|nr:hypothetical protein AVEN_215247-1 [Araneus ventricosus]